MRESVLPVLKEKFAGQMVMAPVFPFFAGVGRVLGRLALFVTLVFSPEIYSRRSWRARAARFANGTAILKWGRWGLQTLGRQIFLSHF